MQVFEYVIIRRLRDEDSKLKVVDLLDGKVHLCMAERWTEVIAHAARDVLAHHDSGGVKLFFKEIELIVRPFQAFEGSAAIYHKCDAENNWECIG